MMNSNPAFALLALPLLGAALSFVAKALPGGKAARVLEYGSAAMGFLLPLGILLVHAPAVLSGEVIEGIIGNWHPSVGIAFRFDGLAWAVNFLGFLVALAAWIYSLGAGPRGPAFTAIFLIQTAALAATAMTADLFNLFVSLEVMGIASYVLVAYSAKPGAFLASFAYLMVSATAMIFFLLGIYGLYRLSGSLSYEGIAAALAALPDGGGLTARVSLALIVGAVAIRVAVMPVYGWLPDAHALAPHAVSAVLSGVLIKTPLFALSRVLYVLPAGALAGELMGYAGAVTAIVAVLVALSQKDAKRLLAYHSVSQIGYVVAAWGAAVHAGISSSAGALLMAAAYLHALYHAMFKGLLFLSVGTVIDVSGQRNVYRLRGAGRLLRRSGELIPLTLIGFFTAALAISAVPPMNGFASKTLLSSSLKGNWEYYLLYAAAIGTVASFIKLSRIFLPGGSEPSEVPESSSAQNIRASAWRGTAQLLLTLLCLAGGIGGSQVYARVVIMFSSGFAAGSGYSSSAIAIPAVYNRETLLTSLIILVSGVLLFSVTTLKPVAALLAIIRNRKRAFHGLFLSFVLGTLALAYWMMAH